MSEINNPFGLQIFKPARGCHNDINTFFQCLELPVIALATTDGQVADRLTTRKILDRG